MLASEHPSLFAVIAVTVITSIVYYLIKTLFSTGLDLPVVGKPGDKFGRKELIEGTAKARDSYAPGMTALMIEIVSKLSIRHPIISSTRHPSDLSL